MDRSFIEALVENTQYRRPHVVDGQLWSPEQGGGWSRAGIFQPEAIRAGTLTALGDYLKANVDSLVFGDLLLHVVDPNQVSLFSKLPSEAEDFQFRRTPYMHVTCEVGPTFGNWMDPDTFIIWLLSHFDESDDKDNLLALVSSMKAENVRQDTDDGYGQEVVVKSGIASVAVKKVTNPVSLAPFRTFAEIKQPISDFIIRFRSHEGQRPTMALFASESSKWKLEAMESIKKWLRILGVTIIA